MKNYGISIACCMIVVAAAPPAHAYNLAGYKWSQASTTFYVSIPGTAPSGTSWNDAFAAAAASWNSRTIFDFNVFSGSADPCAVPTGSGDRNGVEFAAGKCGSAFGSSTLAITRNWSVGGDLVQSGIVFNEAVSWDVYYGPWQGTGHADFKRVATHELGHALGLSHSSAGIMSSYAGNTTSPTADDVAGVNAIYGEPEPPPEEEPPPPPEEEEPPPAESPPEDDDPPPAEPPPPPPEDDAPPPDQNPPPPEDQNPPAPPPEPRPDEIFAGGFEVHDAAAAKRVLASKSGTLVTYDAGRHRIVLHDPRGTRFVLVAGMGRVVPVKGDFDGDGVLDVGTFRALDGLWTLYPGTGGPYWRYRLGAPGDVAVPADYDGDGETDLAVWSPAAQIWRVKPSTLAQTIEISLGKAASDVPVPADYSGDGRADLGIWSKSTGQWLTLDLHTGAGRAYRLASGAGALKAAPGDYDGDGRADPALFDPANGLWTIRASSTGLTAVPQVYNAAGAVPLPADYNDDGVTDLAWWREGQLNALLSGSGGLMMRPLPGSMPVKANMPVVDTTRTARWRP